MSRKRHTPADEPHFLVRTHWSDVPDGHSLAPHAHPWGQLIYAVAGVMTVWTEQGSWVSPPHWAVWAPAGVAHAMRFTGRTSLRTLYMRPDLPRQPARCVVVTVSPLLRELILRVVEIGMLDDRDRTHAAMASLILHELRTQPVPPFTLPQPRSAALRRIADELSSTPADRVGHAAIARRFGTSVRTLERGFERETGMSLGRWRKQVRLLHALGRLGSGASVKQVASEAGYQSASAFVAAFRTRLHATPARYFAARDTSGGGAHT